MLWATCRQDAWIRALGEIVVGGRLASLAAQCAGGARKLYGRDRMGVELRQVLGVSGSGD